MISIHPVKLEAVRESIDPVALDGELAALVAGQSTVVADDPPSIQLSYSEFDSEALDRILGYEEIPRFNQPVGLPGLLEVHCWPGGSRQLLLFPLTGLRDHLVSQNPALGRTVLKHSFGRFIASLEGRDLTVEEYLIGGSLECIKFSLAHNWSVSVFW